MDQSPQVPNLYDYALAQARASAQRRELPKVSEESGVDYSWLSKFALGRIPGASYKKVDQLARYYIERGHGNSTPACHPSEIRQ
jgi:hypothetical protein